jgi:hypothetical protein
VQIPGSGGLEQLSAGGTVSGGLAQNGGLHMWGTDAQIKGVLPEMLGQQVRKPTLLPGPVFERLSIGFQAAAAVTPHGNLYTWGWSGSDSEVWPL